MSISATSAASDILKHGWDVEWARRREIGESLAASIYPWPALTFEIRAQDRIGGFRASTKAPTAGVWMRLQLLGDAVAERSGVLFPGMDWDLDGAETSALFSVTPFTIDETHLGRIVAFAEITRRLCVFDEPIEDRTAFRAVLIELAKESRQDSIRTLKRARRKRSDLRVVDVAPGWFRVEFPPNIAEIRRALQEDDEVDARKARRRGALA